MLGGQGARARVILALREYIWNLVLLALPAFGDTGFLDFPPRRVVSPPGSTLGDCFTFLAGNREVELKPTTFSSLLLLRVFLYFPPLLIP